MGCSWWSPQTVAVVTGGNKGIGHEIVTQLATQGITVVIGARDNERGLAAAQGFHSKGLTNVEFHQLDITDSESVTAFADWIQKTYGGLDILVSQFVRLPIIHYDSGFSSLVPSVTILAHPLHIETYRRFVCFVAYASKAPYVTIGQIASVGFFFYFAITPILGKLEARLIQNSNVCEDLSPRKLSHIFKNLLDVVK
jgi:hypothetical protein